MINIRNIVKATPLTRAMGTIAAESGKLANGVKVATAGGQGDLATVGVYFDFGSRHESEKNNGIANLAARIAVAAQKDAITKLGGHVHSYAGRDVTFVQATVAKAHVAQAVQVLANSTIGGQFSETSISAHKEAVLKQIKHQNDHPENNILEPLQAIAFQTSSLSQSPLGTEKSVKGLSNQEISSYFDSVVSGSGVAIAAGGAVSHKELFDLAGTHFGKVPTSAKCSTLNTEAGRFVGGDIRFREDGHKVARAALAFQTTGASDAYAVPLLVMAEVLGSWNRTSPVGKHSSSYLCRSAGENEIAHKINSFNIAFKDTGLFGVQVECEKYGQQDLFFYVMESLVSLCHDITEPQVARARVAAKAKFLASVEKSSGASGVYGKQLLHYGRIVSVDEMFARIDAVSVDAIKKVGLDLIDDQDVVVAAVGPIFEFPDYAWLRRRAYWQRY